MTAQHDNSLRSAFLRRSVAGLGSPVSGASVCGLPGDGGGEVLTGVKVADKPLVLRVHAAVVV